MRCKSKALTQQTNCEHGSIPMLAFLEMKTFVTKKNGILKGSTNIFQDSSGEINKC